MSKTRSFVETRFNEPGTLAKPGPIGRLVRSLLGIWCLYVVWMIWVYPQALVRSSLPHWSMWISIVFALWLIPPVFNIGWGVNTRGWPRYVAVAAIILGIVASKLIVGAWWTPPLGRLVWLFVLYTFGHLGISFVVSSAIATPGCEMRGLPHLWTLLTGRRTREHYCPGFFDRLDAWEARRGIQAS